MKKELLYGIGGLVAGAAIAGVLVWTVMSSRENTGKEHTNSEIVGKTGDAFDKAFLATMISHHEGALTMAKEAKNSAKHQELKQLADDILSSQSKEVQQMKEWQVNWGYDSATQHQSQTHKH